MPAGRGNDRPRIQLPIDGVQDSLISECLGPVTGGPICEFDEGSRTR